MIMSTHFIISYLYPTLVRTIITALLITTIFQTRHLSHKGSIICRWNSSRGQLRWDKASRLHICAFISNLRTWWEHLPQISISQLASPARLSHLTMQLTKRTSSVKKETLCLLFLLFNKMLCTCVRRGCHFPRKLENNRKELNLKDRITNLF